MVEVSGIGVVIPGIIANTVQKQGVVITLSTTMYYFMSSCSYIALSTNHEQGARMKKKNDYRPVSGYLNSLKDINKALHGDCPLSALILLVFAIKNTCRSVKSDAKSGNSLRFTYLGITLNKHIRQNNLNDVFAGIQDTLKNSDFSSASLWLMNFQKSKR